MLMIRLLGMDPNGFQNRPNLLVGWSSLALGRHDRYGEPASCDRLHVYDSSYGIERSVPLRAHLGRTTGMAQPRTPVGCRRTRDDTSHLLHVLGLRLRIKAKSGKIAEHSTLISYVKGSCSRRLPFRMYRCKQDMLSTCHCSCISRAAVKPRDKYSLTR